MQQLSDHPIGRNSSYAVLFVRSVKDGGGGNDILEGIALSDDGSVVLAGLSVGDFAAVKLDANGTKVWAWQVRWHVGRPELAG